MADFGQRLWQLEEFTPWQEPLVVQPPEFNPYHPFHEVRRATLASTLGVRWEDPPVMLLRDVKFAVLIERQRDFRGVLLPVLDQRLVSL